MADIKIVQPGHVYTIPNIASNSDAAAGVGEQTVTFVKRFRGSDNHDGVVNQQLLAVLIDRVLSLNAEQEWEGNKEILYHLRMALVLHECRALQRKVQKGELLPEAITIGRDGHFMLSPRLVQFLGATDLSKYK